MTSELKEPFLGLAPKELQREDEVHAVDFSPIDDLDRRMAVGHARGDDDDPMPLGREGVGQPPGEHRHPASEGGIGVGAKRDVHSCALPPPTVACRCPTRWPSWRRKPKYAVSSVAAA